MDSPHCISWSSIGMESNPSKKNLSRLDVALILLLGLVICGWFVYEITPATAWVRDTSVRESSKHRFEQMENALADITDDPLISENQQDMSGNECFSRQIEQIFGTNRSFDQVLADYQNALPREGLNQSSECEKIFLNDDMSLVVVTVTDEQFESYSIEEPEYLTYYRVFFIYAELDSCYSVREGTASWFSPTAYCDR
jgi:hypothetical protein